MNNIRTFLIFSFMCCSDVFAWDLSNIKSDDTARLMRNNEELLQRREEFDKSRRDIGKIEIEQNLALIAKISSLEKTLAEQQKIIITYDQLVTQLRKELEVAKNGRR